MYTIYGLFIDLSWRKTNELEPPARESPEPISRGHFFLLEEVINLTLVVFGAEEQDSVLVRSRGQRLWT